MSPVKPVRYTIEILRGDRWSAICGGMTIDQARETQALYTQSVTRIVASLEDGRKVVLP